MLQNSVMAILGMFVFMRSSIPFQHFERESSWRHPTNSTVGTMPPSQFTGKEGEKITISGKLMPEITGGKASIKMLELMADSGGSFPLISGSNFELMGFFVIESIRESRSELFSDGEARAIEFSMSLRRTDEPSLINIADKVMNTL
ncbi:oxidoreductase [[Haemophilus] felis]|nr:oxidoreductase [[Haemophilus] felis]